MSELRDLYQEVILDHNKRPRNFREIEGADKRADGHNPLCGDSLTVFITCGDDGEIQDLSFLGQGCAISKASASLMTEWLRGKSQEDAKEIFEIFHRMVTGKEVSADDAKTKLGKLRVMAGVSEFPVRVKCASLAWHTLQAALEGDQEPITTE